MPVLISQFLPPSPSPTGSTHLLSTAVSLCLPWKYVHLYHFSRFHMYALICGGTKNLSYRVKWVRKRKAGIIWLASDKKKTLWPWVNGMAAISLGLQGLTIMLCLGKYVRKYVRVENYFLKCMEVLCKGLATSVCQQLDWMFLWTVANPTHKTWELGICWVKPHEAITVSSYGLTWSIFINKENGNSENFKYTTLGDTAGEQQRQVWSQQLLDSNSFFYSFCTCLF